MSVDFDVIDQPALLFVIQPFKIMQYTTSNEAILLRVTYTLFSLYLLTDIFSPSLCRLKLRNKLRNTPTQNYIRRQQD